LYFYSKQPRILDRKRLETELDQCRKEGFALDLGEVTPGLNTISAPILGPNANPIGYITLLGLFSVDEVKSYSQLVAEVGKRLSRQLGLERVN
jgi:DNA-binding IclR family transcriptional regulator